MKDMVTVINELTNSETPEESKFEHVIDHHFEKFRYFHYLLKCDGFEDVQSMECTCAEDHQSLSVDLLFEKKQQRDNFREAFETRVNESETFQSQYFIVVLTPTKNSLNISIENKKISREDEIYGDRSDSN